MKNSSAVTNYSIQIVVRDETTGELNFSLQMNKASEKYVGLTKLFSEFLWESMRFYSPSKDAMEDLVSALKSFRSNLS